MTEISVKVDGVAKKLVVTAIARWYPPITLMDVAAYCETDDGTFAVRADLRGVTIVSLGDRLDLVMVFDAGPITAARPA